MGSKASRCQNPRKLGFLISNWPPERLSRDNTRVATRASLRVLLLLDDTRVRGRAGHLVLAPGAREAEQVVQVVDEALRGAHEAARGAGAASTVPWPCR